MKVLWFSNSTANADEYFNKALRGTGGWLKSLDRKVQERVNLNIAFYYDSNGSFKYRNTNYYPIKNYNSYLDKAIKILKTQVITTEHKKEYIDIIDKVQPDIIHIHGTENPFGIINDITEIPVVVSIQGNITVYYHKYLSGIERKYLKTKDILDLKSFLINGAFNSGYTLFEKMRARELKYFPGYKHIIGRTSWDYRITRILAPNSKYYHCDEVLRDSFYEKIWEVPQNNKIVIHTTNANNYYKGFETLCHALHLLNGIALDVEWRVAGIKPNDLIVKVVKKSLGKNFPSKGLILLGGLDEKQLTAKLLESDIYVMPSHIENSPNNLCEAMILGIPCIAAFAGGTGSMLQDNKEGILIQDGDPWAMAGAIIEMIDNRERAIQLGKNARNTALLRHDQNRIVSDLIKIYESIIGQHY